jgi:hypothetical protein
MQKVINKIQLGGGIDNQRLMIFFKIKLIF